MPNPWKVHKAKKAEATAARQAGREVAEANYSTAGPYGLLTLVDPSTATVDIVFVHGITGNRLTTWSTPSSFSNPNPIIWAQTLLPQDLPRARIATWGYDADVLNFWSKASQNRVGEHAGNLISAVVGWRVRTNTTTRPLLFISHSLGGLVVQDALLQSLSSPELHLRTLLPSTHGIAFLGTPHHGADLAAWASSLTKFMSLLFNRKAAEKLVNTLQPESEVLSRIQRDFWGLVRRRNEARVPTPGLGGRLEIACFFEEVGVDMVGVIVERSSATVDGYLAVGIRKSHKDMGKFETRTEEGYVALVNEVWRWVSGIEGDGGAAAAVASLQGGEEVGSATMEMEALELGESSSSRPPASASVPELATRTPRSYSITHQSDSYMSSASVPELSTRSPLGYYSSSHAYPPSSSAQESNIRSPYGAASEPSESRYPASASAREFRTGTLDIRRPAARADSAPDSLPFQPRVPPPQPRPAPHHEEDDQSDGESWGGRTTPQPTVYRTPRGDIITQHSSTFGNVTVTGNGKIHQGNVLVPNGSFTLNL